MSETTDLVENQIDEVLEQTVVSWTPQLLLSWIHEVAQKILPPATIARKYGFASAEAMRDIIATNEALRRKIKAERMVWDSQDNLATRVRTQHQLILHETAHENAKPLLDPSTSVPQRVDLMKAIASIAGVNGMPGGGGRGMDGAPDGTPRWTIQMVFPNAGRVEEITLREAPQQPQPPTIEGEASG